MKKLLRVFLLGFVLLTQVGNVSAQDSTNVVIHNQVSVNKNKQDTPYPQGNEAILSSETKGLNDIEFEVYDAGDFIASFDENTSLEEIQIVVMNRSIKDLVQDQTLRDKRLETYITATQNGEDGVIQFPIETQDQAILIVQKINPMDAYRAMPMLLVLPVLNPIDNTPLTTIHLYPKNIPKKDTEIPRTEKPPTVAILPNTGIESKKTTRNAGVMISIGLVLLIIERKKREIKHEKVS